MEEIREYLLSLELEEEQVDEVMKKIEELEDEGKEDEEEGLTLEAISKMTPEEINENWKEVQAVLKAAK